MDSAPRPHDSPAAPGSPAGAGSDAASTGFWLYAGHLFTVFGIALSNLLLGLSVGVGALRLRSAAMRRRFDWESQRPIWIPLGLYALFLLASFAQSTDRWASRGSWSELHTLGTLVLAPLLVRGERAVRRTVDALIVLVAILAVYGFVQYYGTDAGGLENRIRGPFSHYMTYAGVLLIGDFLLFGRLVTRRAWRPLLLPVLVLVNWALLLTLTRGPWIALVATLALYGAFRVRRLARLALPAAIVALLFMVFGPASAVARLRSIGDISDPSHYDRLCMANAGLQMIRERPLFGTGPDTMKSLYPVYRHPTAPRYTVPHLHNAFLQLAAERGLLSLAAYLGLTAGALAMAFKGYAAGGGSRGPRADLYLGALLAIVGYNLGGLFEDNWRDTEVQRLLLFVLAIPLCLQPEREEPPPGEPVPTA